MYHHTPGGLLPHLLTLTFHDERRLFSSPLLNPRGLLAVNKWDALCCPDFPLSPPERDASDKPSDCFQRAKVRKSLQYFVLFLRELHRGHSYELVVSSTKGAMIDKDEVLVFRLVEVSFGR